MSLSEYKKKRRFDVTPEPAGQEKKTQRSAEELSFVIQKHQASRLHYDFRLEWKGVMLSWAVPKGPSLDPSVKRLAMPVEDHPIEYNEFEGVIPEGEYGGGTVMIWDRGTWTPEIPDVDAAMEKGDLKFSLDGQKLHGSWVLVRTSGRSWSSSGRPSWLLIKHRDKFVSTDDITVEMPKSAVSRKLMAQIARANDGNVEKAAAADPPSSSPILPARKMQPRNGTSKTAGKKPSTGRKAKSKKK